MAFLVTPPTHPNMVPSGSKKAVLSRSVTLANAASLAVRTTCPLKMFGNIVGGYGGKSFPLRRAFSANLCSSFNEDANLVSRDKNQPLINVVKPKLYADWSKPLWGLAQARSLKLGKMDSHVIAQISQESSCLAR